MSNPAIVKFNNYLTLFVSNIIDTFPEFKDVLESYYEPLFSNNTCEDDKYVKRFMKIGFLQGGNRFSMICPCLMSHYVFLRT